MAVQRPSNSPSYWKEISQNPASSVHLVHHKLHLSFPPYYLGDLKNSVKSVVDARLSRYEQELGGILAGYGKIAILKSRAQTLFNLTDVHVDVEGDFYVFNPEVGKQLTGVVNRKSHGHLGCLVHNLFNVSLPKPYTINADDWLGRPAKLADEVKFIITKVDLQSQVPYIEGNIAEVISTSKSEEPCSSTERSNSDSGVSVASEYQLAAEDSIEDSLEADSTMDKKRSKLSLSQRKKEALSSKAKSSPKAGASPPKATLNKVRKISYSDDSNSSHAEMGESIHLELSADTANASEKSSDSEEEIKSPKSKVKKGSASPKKHLKTSFVDNSPDSGTDEKMLTPASKIKKVLAEADSSSTPAAKKAKQQTPKSGKKAASAESVVKPVTVENSPPKSKKRKRADDSIVKESPKTKKSKVSTVPDENNDAESVDDLLTDLFAAISKKNTSQIESESDATPKRKRTKSTSAQKKQDSSQLASQLLKGIKPATATPKSATKAKIADTSVSSPKVSRSPKTVKPDLDATLQQIVDRHLSEKTQPSEPMEVDEDAANTSAFTTPAKKNERKKKTQASEQEVQTPFVTPKAKEASSKKKARPASNLNKTDIDSDEGVDVSETPVIKSKKVKSEKTSTPRVTKPAAERAVFSTPVPTSIASLEGITPIRNTPAAKQSSKKKAPSEDQSTPKVNAVKTVKQDAKEEDDPESIIQELLQSSIRGSPSVSAKKTSSTPAQGKDDSSRKIQTSVKKKAESDITSNKRRSLQPGKGKKLKMEDDDPKEKTIMKILQAVQPKEKSKVKSSKK